MDCVNYYKLKEYYVMRYSQHKYSIINIIKNKNYKSIFIFPDGNDIIIISEKRSPSNYYSIELWRRNKKNYIFVDFLCNFNKDLINFYPLIITKLNKNLEWIELVKNECEKVIIELYSGNVIHTHNSVDYYERSTIMNSLKYDLSYSPEFWELYDIFTKTNKFKSIKIKSNDTDLLIEQSKLLIRNNETKIPIRTIFYHNCRVLNYMTYDRGFVVLLYNFKINMDLVLFYKY